MDLDLTKLTDDRKLRLFAVACVREVSDLLFDERSKNAVDVAERFADGLASEEELDNANSAAWTTANSVAMDAAWSVAWAAYYTTSVAYNAASNAAYYSARFLRDRTESASACYAEYDAAKEKQQLFLNDITDKPNIIISPESLAWNNQTLSKLATQIYNNKQFEDMSILADALQDANATTQFIQHCYKPVHIKGCWLIDILMEK